MNFKEIDRLALRANLTPVDQILNRIEELRERVRTGGSELCQETDYSNRFAGYDGTGTAQSFWRFRLATHAPLDPGLLNALKAAIARLTWGREPATQVLWVTRPSQRLWDVPIPPLRPPRTLEAAGSRDGFTYDAGLRPISVAELRALHRLTLLAQAMTTPMLNGMTVPP